MALNTEKTWIPQHELRAIEEPTNTRKATISKSGRLS